MKTLMRTLGSDHSKVLFDQAIFSGMNFLCSIVFARILGLTEFGIYSSIILLSYLVISASSAIIVQPMQTLYSSIKDKSKYISAIIGLQGLIVLVIMVIIEMAFAIGESYFSDIAPYCNAVCFFIAMTMIFDFLRKKLLIEDQINTTLLTDMILAVFQVGIIIFAFNNDTTAVQLIMLLGCAYLPIILFHTLYAQVQYPTIKEILVYWKSHYKQAKWLLPTAVIQWSSSNFFVAASGLLISVEALGAFRLVQSIFGIFNIFLQSFESYILPQASKLYHSSANESKVYLKNISVKSLIGFGGLLVGMFIFSDQILRLVGGAQYDGYGYVVKGMTLLYFIIILNYPFRISIRIMMMDHLFFGAYLASFVFSVLAAHILLSEFQLIGAMIGLTVNQLIMMAIWHYYLNKNSFTIWK
jgi:O-antigen/teichoic acid export membrane protein